jgi:pimeloyl-ACP methyl ester carboxylesterase
MQERNKSVSGFANVNGAQLYHEAKGAGAPLLLLHAGVADSRMWDEQFDAFARHYRVVRFDMRGFGRSDMPPGAFANHDDVRGLLDELGVASAYVAAVSFGGLVALDFALAYPARVKALALGAPSVSGASPSDRIRRFWDEEEAALEAGDIDGATELNLRLWVDGPQREPHEVDPQVRERVRQMQAAIFRKEIPDDVEQVELVPPAMARLGSVDAPVLVLVGALDLPEKLTLAEQLVRALPDARMVVLPGVAHMLNMERPAQFNRAVLDFLTAL